MKASLIIFFVLVLTFSIGYAYTPRNHRIITRYAIELLNRKFGKNFITARESSLMVRGNSSEDENVFKSITRLLNEHYYNPIKQRVDKSRKVAIDRRFERIASKAFRISDRGRFFYIVGELCHHIQDVTNPSHVIPLFHGSTFKDKFDRHHVQAYFPVKLDIDTSFAYFPPYVNSILKPIAMQTLSHLKDTFPVTLNYGKERETRIIDWSYFWREDPGSWFGSYGYLGHPGPTKGKPMDNYMREQIQKGDTTYIINKKVYDDFSYRQLALAVNQTAQFIYFAKRWIGQRRNQDT